MIEVVNVTYHYGIRPVLCDINLSITPAQIVALMGPNGMGKTTLLGVMAGVLSPLEGYVQIDGSRRRSSPERELDIRRKVFYLPADAWLPRHYTPREWLISIGRLYGIASSRLHEHVPRILNLFGLKKQSDHRITSCSTG